MPTRLLDGNWDTIPPELGEWFAPPPGAVLHALSVGGSRQEWVRQGVASASGTVATGSTQVGQSHSTAAGSNFLSLGFGLPAQGYFIACAIFLAPSGSTYRGLVSATDSGQSRHEIFLDNAGQVGVSANAFFEVSSGNRLDDGRLHCLIGGYDAGGRWAYVDGVESVLSTPLSLAVGQVSATRVGALCDATTPYSFGGQIALAFFATGSGSRAWARIASADPLGVLFHPPDDWVPVASGGGSYSLTAEQGSYTITGQAVGLLAGRVLAAAQGSYTLTGQSVALIKGNVLAAAQGAYALTGQDVGLLRGILLSAAQGSYALSGQDATLTYTPLGAYSLAADQGIYTLTGQSASLLWGPVLAAGQGSYALTGQDVTLTYTPVGAYILTAGQGSYALTGQDVLLQWGHVLVAAQGSYTLTGQAAALARGLVLAAAQGSYTLTGQAAAFARTYVLSAGYGSYALTGQIVSLSYSGAALEALEYLLLISHITQSMSKTSKVTMEVDLISRIQ